MLTCLWPQVVSAPTPAYYKTRPDVIGDTPLKQGFNVIFRYSRANAIVFLTEVIC